MSEVFYAALAAERIDEISRLRTENAELRNMLREFVKDPIHQLRMTDTGVLGPHFVLVAKDHVYKAREKLGMPEGIDKSHQETQEKINKYWDEKIAAAALKETQNE